MNFKQKRKGFRKFLNKVTGFPHNWFKRTPEKDAFLFQQLIHNLMKEGRYVALERTWRGLMIQCIPANDKSDHFIAIVNELCKTGLTKQFAHLVSTATKGRPTERARYNAIGLQELRSVLKARLKNDRLRGIQ